MARVPVSVLVDTYNHELFLEDAIRSVLGQDFPAADREIVVVDDGSTDRTPEILSKFADQIRILRKPNGARAVPSTMPFLNAAAKSLSFSTVMTGGRQTS